MRKVIVLLIVGCLIFLLLHLSVYFFQSFDSRESTFASQQCSDPTTLVNPLATERIRQRRINTAINEGLPASFAQVLFRVLPPCVHCASLGSNWPEVDYRVHSEKFTERYGVEPDSYFMTVWNAHTERFLRHGLKEGLITELSFSLGDEDCACCERATMSHALSSAQNSFVDAPWNRLKGAYATHYRSYDQFVTDFPEDNKGNIVDENFPQTSCEVSATLSHKLIGTRFIEPQSMCDACVVETKELRELIQTMNAVLRSIDSLRMEQASLLEAMECLLQSLENTDARVETEHTQKLTALTKRLFQEKQQSFEVVTKKIYNFHSRLQVLRKTFNEDEQRMKACEVSACLPTSTGSLIP